MIVTSLLMPFQSVSTIPKYLPKISHIPEVKRMVYPKPIFVYQSHIWETT
jgi:hypothetical protein